MPVGRPPLQHLLHSRLRRISNHRQAAWFAFFIGSIAASAVLIGALIFWQQAVSQTQHLEAQNRQLPRQSASVTSSAPDATSAIPKDFTQQLSAQPSVRPVLAELQRQATESNVVLTQIQLQDHPAAADQLARTELSFSVRGSYAKTKQAIAETVDRFPSLTLVQWRMHRHVASDEVESNVLLTLWGAPAPARTAR